MSVSSTTAKPEMTLKQALGTPPKMLAAGVWMVLSVALGPLMVALAARTAIVAGSDDAGVWQAFSSGAVFQDAMLLGLFALWFVCETLFICLPFYLGKDVLALLKQKLSFKKNKQA